MSTVCGKERGMGVASLLELLLISLLLVKLKRLLANKKSWKIE